MSVTIQALFAAWLVVIVFAAGIAVGRFEGNKLLNECQRELPRNQYCELVALPLAPQEAR